MKKNWLHLIIYIAWLSAVVACQSDEKAPRKTVPVTFEAEPLPHPSADTAAQAQHRRLVNNELEYYLSRHNVDDEGFDMVARYAEEGDSTLSAYMPQGHATPLGILKLRHMLREGKGIAHDSCGHLIIGTWRNDTLVSGIRIDSLGIYAGQFNRHMKASGHGSFRSVDGSYYEGHWQDDQREGFGFRVSASNLQAGIWKSDRFLGERMHYTSDRIYGIDISRYQHEMRRRVYPITWRYLRITGLGTKANRPVQGNVDYPVSFVYIKATEGTSIYNRYFAADYAAARRYGIHVGAYHFFRTRQGGRIQANYFLSKARFQHGDLPPVLDIEPTDRQIQQMGGSDVLFREIREWIKVVEKRTGVRPILYVNQRFVKKYLDEAPDLKRDYLVWIARYGAYKPDVHLALWQLSADGRVNGIRPEVDINVFNGYEGQWEEFLREECVK